MAQPAARPEALPPSPPLPSPQYLARLKAYKAESAEMRANPAAILCDHRPLFLNLGAHPLSFCVCEGGNFIPHPLPQPGSTSS